MPFKPSSGAHLGIFNVAANIEPHSTNATGPQSQDPENPTNGAFGSGSLYQNSAFWFSLHSGSFGCQNGGKSQCSFTATGYRMTPSLGGIFGAEPEASLTFTTPPCLGLAPAGNSSCPLHYVDFDALAAEKGDGAAGELANLTSVLITATLMGGDDGNGHKSSTPVTWYVDDLALAWADSGCEATRQRQVQGGLLR